MRGEEREREREKAGILRPPQILILISIPSILLSPFPFPPGILLLARYARVLDPASAAGPPGLPAAALRHALAGGLGAWFGYALVQGGPSVGPPPLIRPHPALWRAVHAAGVAYMVALSFLACLSGPGARAAIAVVAPALGDPLPERSYGADCRLVVPADDLAVAAAGAALTGRPAAVARLLSTSPLARLVRALTGGARTLNAPSLAGTVWDEFVLAHLLGWFFKALLLRDRRLLWPLSLAFEAAEASLAHALPNFNECWWDAWLLDAAACNWAGMEAGLAAARWLGSREVASWAGAGLSRQRGAVAKVRRALLQLTPASWTAYDWAPLASPARAAGAATLVAAVLACELNTFFLKAVLWIPPTHPLVLGRMTLLWALGLPAVAEAHAFLAGVSAPRSHGAFLKLGAAAWLAGAVAAVETLVVVKLGLTGGGFGVPARPRPAWVVAGWGAGVGGVGVGLAGWEVARRRGRSERT